MRWPGSGAVDRRLEVLAVVGEHDPEGGLAQTRRLFQHGVEHRGEVAGRGVDACKTSAVAVCCSNASRVSVNSRAFSIAMTACAAKFCSSAICLSEKGRTSCRLAVMAPSSLSSLRSGTTS
jgi:hypothetical protein